MTPRIGRRQFVGGAVAFDVDPGSGATTSIDVTYYRTAATPGAPATAYDTFRLEKPRRAPSSSTASSTSDGSAWPAVAAAAVGTAALATAGGVALRRRSAHPTAAPGEPGAGQTDEQ